MRWAASGTSPRSSGPRAPTTSWCSRPITAAPLWLSASSSSAPALARDARGALFDAFDEGHGRLVRRRVFVAPVIQDLEPLHGWPDLSAVLAVETIRSVNGSGQVEAEIRYFLTSCSDAPAVLVRAIRRHWSVEKDRKSTRLNSSHANISYAVFCLK